MANKLYTISEFGGIDQSREESLIDRGSTADACNMDTSDGALSVASGYSRHIAQPVPDAEEISHFYIFETTEHGVQTVVMAGRSIWAFRGGEWTKIYEYQTERIPTKFACTEAKIGDTDHLLIACGESGIVKYDGETAADFGSGENLSNVSAAYVTMFSGRLFAAGVPEHDQTCRMVFAIQNFCHTLNLLRNELYLLLLFALNRVLCPLTQIHKENFVLPITELTTMILAAFLVLVENPEGDTDICSYE